MALDIMLDLETLGTEPGCVILSIGAVAFDWETGDIHGRFQVNIDRTNSEQEGFEVSQSTLDWWLKQSDATWEAATKDAIHVLRAIDSFRSWLACFRFDGIWGNSAAFDNEILKAYYLDLANGEVPWSYKQDRCYRTMKALFPEIKSEKKTVSHVAVEDAEAQALHLSAILQHIKGIKNGN